MRALSHDDLTQLASLVMEREEAIRDNEIHGDPWTAEDYAELRERVTAHRDALRF